MIPIRYMIGDATRPQGEGLKIIVHIVNNKNAWGLGFVLALSKRWSLPEQTYRDSFKSKDSHPQLGDVQLAQVEPDICVINMVAQILGDPTGINIRYSALETCLKQVAKWAQIMNASVHGPRFGAGLAGGEWFEVEQLIQHCLCNHDIPVYVYDLPPRN